MTSAILLSRKARKLKAIKDFIKKGSDGKPLLKDGKTVPISEDHRSKTLQSFTNQVNINTIMKQAEQTGQLGNPQYASQVQGMYVDLTTIPNLHEAQNRIATANQSFDALPADVRNRFDNTPQKLLDFMSSETNIEESYSLGLRKRPVDLSKEDEPAKTYTTQKDSPELLEKPSE